MCFHDLHQSPGQVAFKRHNHNNHASATVLVLCTSAPNMLQHSRAVQQLQCPAVPAPSPQACGHQIAPASLSPTACHTLLQDTLQMPRPLPKRGTTCVLKQHHPQLPSYLCCLYDTLPICPFTPARLTAAPCSLACHTCDACCTSSAGRQQQPSCF